MLLLEGYLPASIATVASDNVLVYGGLCHGTRDRWAEQTLMKMNDENNLIRGHETIGNPRADWLSTGARTLGPPSIGTSS